uniref:Uncharacterized protein n=1 Tax=Anguilla anguilla TaxID=7936 RepID=A0A0E9SRD4_ANGAN
MIRFNHTYSVSNLNIYFKKLSECNFTRETLMVVHKLVCFFV